MNINALNRISVIVPAKNEETHIELCLNALLNQDYDNEFYEIIVVDNNSTDQTLNIVKKFSRIRVISCPSGPVGRVRNDGTKCAEGSILAFIDADCIAPPDWLKNINLTVKDGIVVGGGAKLPSPPNDLEKFWLLEGPDGHSLPKELIGASIAITKRDFENARGFNELLPSGEDSEFSLRIKRNNNTVKITRDFSVIHLGNAKSTNDFIKRQMWHGENYSYSFLSRIKEPIFILTILWTLSIYLTFASLYLGENAIYFIFIALFIPCILCFKRILRSKHKLESLNNLAKIYYLDFLYVTGRSLGMQKALIGRMFK